MPRQGEHRGQSHAAPRRDVLGRGKGGREGGRRIKTRFWRWMYNLIPSAGDTRFAKSGDAERFNNGHVAVASPAVASFEGRTCAWGKKKKLRATRLPVTKTKGERSKMRFAFDDLKKKGLPIDVMRGKCLLPINSLQLQLPSASRVNRLSERASRRTRPAQNWKIDESKDECLRWRVIIVAGKRVSLRFLSTLFFAPNKMWCFSIQNPRISTTHFEQMVYKTIIFILICNKLNEILSFLKLKQ